MLLPKDNFMENTEEFCENLRLYVQFWDKKNSEDIVGYCRKNLLKPVKLRKKDIYRCISTKLSQERSVGNFASKESSIENFHMV
uniref:Uncharacterized protein n=1 Tax=Promethearchaeum syntrophicum TaxID=2594042 RepID=A0A5B9DES1_9ARCH|nr:hypothetical protein [Candidatus Prometheoarchaeum syntrophicum]QEE17758.1 hypothetical protein DSAG12_03596 [Candidatus Prometheoarchaeum syntrophicum]